MPEVPQNHTFSLTLNIQLSIANRPFAFSVFFLTARIFGVSTGKLAGSEGAYD
jgi:hypothetical protein